MSVSVILAHPNRQSFNHAIAAACVKALDVQGHEVHFHDLYAERFDSLLPFEEFGRDAPLPGPIEQHCAEISTASGIIIIHPNWWGQPPAILKGWVDRIMRPGVAYQFGEGDSGEGVPKGLLRAQSAVVFNTSNTSEAREQNVFSDPLESIWKRCIFGLCGVANVYRRTFGIVVTSSERQRQQWLAEVSRVIEEHYPRMSHNRVAKGF